MTPLTPASQTLNRVL